MEVISVRLTAEEQAAIREACMIIERLAEMANIHSTNIAECFLENGVSETVDLDSVLKR